MVINYKKVNKNTKFDGYYIPNKAMIPLVVGLYNLIDGIQQIIRR